ncbi:hypothetical protein L1049_022406 [Liquidambar formosana]|uniref:Aminotransferase-like plant mobile domain-containing protein n=1 Tax=Liquidambar formosana TaxID=63359 RepID=A0AAP0RDT2_LIQFO
MCRTADREGLFECRARVIAHRISCTFFTGTGDLAPLGLLASMEDVDKIRKFNWGGAALATMYRTMCDMSRGVTKDFGGMPFVWEVWCYEYLNLCRPSLAEETIEWPTLKNYSPSYVSIRAANRHDYAFARAHLASLTADMVKFFPYSFPFPFTPNFSFWIFEQIKWNPWKIWVPMLPKRCIPSLILMGKKVLLEGPVGRYWYLGEGVLRQVMGDVNAAMAPMPPPLNMRHTNLMEGEELWDALRGWDAEEFTSPDIAYDTFCLQYLMRPRVTGLPPQGVPTAYAQEFIDLSEGLRRDLVRMSLAKSMAEARLDVVPPPAMRPPRAPRGGRDGAEPSRKRSSGNR